MSYLTYHLKNHPHYEIQITNENNIKQLWVRCKFWFEKERWRPVANQFSASFSDQDIMEDDRVNYSLAEMTGFKKATYWTY